MNTPAAVHGKSFQMNRHCVCGRYEATAIKSPKQSSGSTIPVACFAGMIRAKITTDKTPSPPTPVFEKPTSNAAAIASVHSHEVKFTPFSSPRLQRFSEGSTEQFYRWEKSL